MKITLRTERDREMSLIALKKANLGQTVEINDKKRSNAQNSRLWAMLSQISDEMIWYGHRLTPEEWKDVFTAAWKRQKTVRGIEGGFVVLGHQTSKMTVSEMSDLQTLIEAFAAEKGIQLRDDESYE